MKPGLVFQLREASGRVVKHCFRQSGDSSLMSIPARPSYDVDLLLMDAAEQIERLHQFIRNAAENCNCAETIVDMRAALDGEYLYQQLPGWKPTSPFAMPADNATAEHP